MSFLIYQYHNLSPAFSLYQDRGKEQFHIMLRNVYKAINSLMADTSQKLVHVQGACLKYLPMTIPDVITVLDPIEFRYCVQSRHWISVLFKLCQKQNVEHNLLLPSASCQLQYWPWPTFSTYILLAILLTLTYFFYVYAIVGTMLTMAFFLQTLPN